MRISEFHWSRINPDALPGEVPITSASARFCDGFSATIFKIEANAACRVIGGTATGASEMMLAIWFLTSRSSAVCSSMRALSGARSTVSVETSSTISSLGVVSSILSSCRTARTPAVG